MIKDIKRFFTYDKAGDKAGQVVDFAAARQDGELVQLNKAEIAAKAAEQDDLPAVPIETSKKLATRQALGVTVLTAAVAGASILSFGSHGSPDRANTERAVPDGDPVVATVNWQTPKALQEGKQTPITVLPGEGQAQIAERTVPNLNSSQEFRDNVIGNLALDNPTPKVGDVVDLPSAIVDPVLVRTADQALPKHR
jgi:hypothetical protein